MTNRVYTGEHIDGCTRILADCAGRATREFFIIQRDEIPKIGDTIADFAEVTAVAQLSGYEPLSWAVEDVYDYYLVIATDGIHRERESVIYQIAVRKEGNK